MMTENPESESLPEYLQVLKSIYPELEISTEGQDEYQLEIVKEFQLSKPIRYELLRQKESGGMKLLQSFESPFVEGLRFQWFIPRSSFKLETCWISGTIIDQISKDIHLINQEGSLENEERLYMVFDFVMAEIEHKYESLIFSNYLIETTSPTRYESYKYMTKRARLHKFQTGRFECSICLESKDGKEDGILLDCDHPFCRACLRDFFERTINGDDVLKLQCPNCPFESLKNLKDWSAIDLKKLLFTDKVEINTLREVRLDEELIAKYENLLELSRFEKYRTVYPFSSSKCPRCLRWIFRDNVDDKLMHCRYCKFAYCFDCNHSWHGTTNLCGSKLNTIPIDIIAKIANNEVSESSLRNYQTLYGRHNLKLSVDAYVADKLFYEAVDVDDELVKCPNCNVVITKSDGCNKIKCFVCSENFCYLCGDSLPRSNPYTHFSDIYAPCYGKLFEGMPGTEEIL